MIETPNLKLPFLQPSQAQKHVTVNEALSRIDAVTGLTLRSRVLNTPPALPVEGDVYFVAVGGVNEWAGHDGELAAFVNGGWVFASARKGWSAYIADEGVSALFDGTEWIAEAVAVTGSGAATVQRIIEFDHTLTAGTFSLTSVDVPGQVLVYGVTGRILSQITGSLSTWRLGTATSFTLFGGSYATATGTAIHGIDNWPHINSTAVALRLAANTGDITGGTVRLAIHFIDIAAPRAV